jgi:hypothetical protein
MLDLECLCIHSIILYCINIFTCIHIFLSQMRLIYLPIYLSLHVSVVHAHHQVYVPSAKIDIHTSSMNNTHK